MPPRPIHQARPLSSAVAGAGRVLVPDVVPVMMTVMMMVHRTCKRRVGAEKQRAECENDCRERLIHEIDSLC